MTALAVPSRMHARFCWSSPLILIAVGCMTAWIGPSAPAQQQTTSAPDSGWQRYDWLGSSSGASGEKITATATQSVSDPFAVVTGNALWQEQYGVTYTHPLNSDLSLAYETNAVTLNEDSLATPASSEGTPDQLSHEQKAGLQFQPFQGLSLAGNLHDSSEDAASPSSSLETRGGGVSLVSPLPLSSELTLAFDSDSTTTGSFDPDPVIDNSYDAQLKKPLGKLPLTVVLKGHFEETTQNGAAVSQLPSLEQSLVWKANDSTTLQMGLRQQHYQAFPGITNELNEAVFADWSQTLLPEVTWHSYAEVIDSRGTDLAPAVPTTTGTNGTPQSADPTNASAIPGSLNDEAITFSTGPSFKLDRDLSASVEYSNRLDKATQAGDGAQEQRVSVSLKGSF